MIQLLHFGYSVDFGFSNFGFDALDTKKIRDNYIKLVEEYFILSFPTKKTPLYCLRLLLPAELEATCCPQSGISIFLRKMSFKTF